MDSVRAASDRFREAWAALQRTVGQIIVGQDSVVEETLIALIGNGHVLLEGVPGLGKTLLVNTLSRSLALESNRIQFTPDVMPADITGTTLVTEDESGGSRKFVFQPGPIFTQLLLADEINRATPKTQAALLEAMQERSVTVGGETHPLRQPFLVMATQNPIEQEGTYRLPEAQLDRFFFKVMVPLGSRAEINEIVERTTRGAPPEIGAILDSDAIVAAQHLARNVVITPAVQDYIVRLTLASHPGSEHSDPSLDRFLAGGVSPRAAQALTTGARVVAMVDGRYAAGFDDVQRVAAPVMRHRLLRTFEADSEQMDGDAIVEHLLKHVPRIDERSTPG
ncbi:MAG: AAA family ATPase [Phycisphaerales bacterium]